jgi:hypothetical protein
MELLPPLGWADVATKHDLLALEARMKVRFESFEHRLDARFERGFRTVVVTLMSRYITGFVATILAVALTR